MKYIKSRDSYTSTTLSGRNVSYSVSRYGKYAKELALKAEESLDKPLCLIEEQKAKQLAIDARLYYERQFGYINNESSTTRENTSIGEKP
jgi:hypothetical protein